MRMTQTEVIHAAKVYEDALQRIIGEEVFDDWLERIPDVDISQYTSILMAMLENLRKYRKPSKQQIDLTLNLGLANLKYNQLETGR